MQERSLIMLAIRLYTFSLIRIFCSNSTGSPYTVLEAANGDEALRLLEKRADTEPAPQLLVTDMIMPQMSGSELAKQIGKLYPAIKVLFISGYTGNALTHHRRLDDGVTLLQKPFSPTLLARTVRTLLDSDLI
jgi:two-component system, cell cycle sensor histidine kinase and response regulator CckA